MVQVCNTLRRSSDLDNHMERARRELVEFQRLEAEEFARRQAETRRWYEWNWEKFKPQLERFLGFFSEIRELEDDWRRDVFCGRAPFEERSDQIVRGLYALWLFYSRMFKEKAEFLGRNLPGVLDESLDRLVRSVREGDRLLRAWEPPVLSRGPSFRAPVLSPEATARFKEMFPEKK
jgi:hypothetical protein